MLDRNLLTEFEIHEFGIQIVEKDLRRDGFQIISINYQIYCDPQIIAKRNGRLYHILVRTACYPKKGKIENRENGYQALNGAKTVGALCFFASVGIANSDGTTDLEMATPVRGAGYYIAYEGIKQLTPELINSLASFSSSKAYNQYGDIAGFVTNLPDGRHVLNIGAEGDMSSLIMSMGMVFADNLLREQQIVFSQWAGLPLDMWTTTHREFFSIALMHYFMDVKVKGGGLPSKIMKAIDMLPPQVLPDLPCQLDDTIIGLFSSLFSSSNDYY